MVTRKKQNKMADEQNIKLQNAIIEKWSSKVIQSLKSEVGSMFPPKGKNMVQKNTKGFITTPKNYKAHKQPISGFVMREPGLKNSIKAKLFKHGSPEIEGISITFARHGIFILKGAGPGDRTPIDWINPTLDREFPKLADQIGEINADAILKTTADKLKK
jgi:hypothetical protein